MTEQREQELISASIDGEINNDERIELDRLLEASTEARDLKSNLEQLDALLKDLPDLEPPVSLHASIMAQTAPNSAERQSSLTSWLHELVPGAGLRYIFATGAGAIIALLVVGGQPLEPGPFDYSELVGTMSPEASQDGAEILDSYVFGKGGAAGQMQLRRIGDALFLDINTSQPVEIAADFGGAGLWPDLVAQVDGRSESIAIAGQAMQIQTSGEQQLTILLRRVDAAATAGEAEISLEISSDGRVLDSGVLTAPL
jgi:hypothetical protein